MKKVILFTFVASAIFLVGFRYLSNLGAATVDQEQGLYVFHKSKPASEYEYLGTVKTPGVVPNYKFETISDILIKRAKDNYPTANGIIIKEYEADVIRLKE